MEEEKARELRGRHGCIAVPIVFVIGLFALSLIVATFALWRRGDLRLPELGPLTRVGDGSTGVVAIAALALILMFLALVMMIFCCACRGKGFPLGQLLRPLIAALNDAGKALHDASLAAGTIKGLVTTSKSYV